MKDLGFSEKGELLDVQVQNQNDEESSNVQMTEIENDDESNSDEDIELAIWIHSTYFLFLKEDLNNLKLFNKPLDYSYNLFFL